MEKRLQTVNDDTVLEVTKEVTTKERYSEKALLRRKTYLEDGIEKFSAELEDVNTKLNDIETERTKE